MQPGPAASRLPVPERSDHRRSRKSPPPAKMKSSRYGNNFFITCGIKELKIFDEFKKLRNEFTGFLRKFQYPFALRGSRPKTDCNCNIRFVL